MGNILPQHVLGFDSLLLAFWLVMLAESGRNGSRSLLFPQFPSLHYQRGPKYFCSMHRLLDYFMRNERLMLTRALSCIAIQYAVLRLATSIESPSSVRQSFTYICLRQLLSCSCSMFHHNPRLQGWKFKPAYCYIFLI